MRESLSFKDLCISILGEDNGNIKWGDGNIDLSLFDNILQKIPENKAIYNVIDDRLGITIAVTIPQLEKINWVVSKLKTEYRLSITE